MSRDSFVFKKKVSILDTDMESVRGGEWQSSSRSAKEEWLDSQSFVGDDVGLPYASLFGDDIGAV